MPRKRTRKEEVVVEEEEEEEEENEEEPDEGNAEADEDEDDEEEGEGEEDDEAEVGEEEEEVSGSDEGEDEDAEEDEEEEEDDEEDEAEDEDVAGSDEEDEDEEGEGLAEDDYESKPKKTKQKSLRQKKSDSGGGMQVKTRNRSNNIPGANAVANTSQMASHGPMTSASAANTPARSGDHKRGGIKAAAPIPSTNSTKPRRKRISGTGTPGPDDEQSDDEDVAPTTQRQNQEDEEEDAFAAESMVVPSATAGADAASDKRHFKHLDPFAQIPIRVTRKASTAAQPSTLGAKGNKSSETSVPQEVIVKKYSIPAPPTTAGAIAFDKMLPGPYTPTLAYVRFRPDMIKPRDYEMTYEDEQWLAQKKLLESEKFEKVITLLEIATNTGSMINATKAFQVIQGFDPSIPKPVSDEIHSYWQSRRQKNSRRPLLRRFWPITPAEDTTPTSTFRPREKERYKLRKKRMNDMESYEKLLYLKRDFERVRDLLDLVKRREEMKQLEVELIHAEYLERLNGTNTRPACLDTPLAPLMDQQAEFLDLNISPLANTYASLDSHHHRLSTGSHRRGISMMDQEAKATPGGTASSSMKIAQQLKSSQQQQPPGKRRRMEEERESMIRAGGNLAAGSGGIVSTSQAQAQVPEAPGPQILDSQIVPIPRYLLEPTSDQPALSNNFGLTQLYPAHSKKNGQPNSHFRKIGAGGSLGQNRVVHIVPRFGRNRRLLFDRVSLAQNSSQVIPTMSSLGERGRGMGMMIRSFSTSNTNTYPAVLGSSSTVGPSGAASYPLYLPSAQARLAVVADGVDPIHPSPQVIQKIESILSSVDDRFDDDETVDTVDFAFFDVLSSSLFPRVPEPANPSSSSSQSNVITIPNKPPKFQLMV